MYKCRHNRPIRACRFAHSGLMGLMGLMDVKRVGDDRGVSGAVLKRRV